MKATRKAINKVFPRNQRDRKNIFTQNKLINQTARINLLNH